MADLRKLTILHSNDMHGDFMAEQVDDKLVGGVSLLSGYLNKVRSEEENVIYAIAGDMFRGSVIDSEFKGVSTIEIMNMLAPNVVTLGNHETDYGIAHLLFLEKCARFPIVNANLYLKNNHVRLFKSHKILKVGGMKVLFIGILTEQVLAQTRKEALIGSFVDIREAAREVGRICDSFRTEDIDLTVLLTHIGIEEDKQLAAILDPNWGVDVIIGGHSHTFLKEPEKVNGILIVQAGTGTDAIGRFDITVDCDTNSVHDYTWQLIPIDDKNCPVDTALEAVLKKYKDVTDEKYCRYVTRFQRTFTHPRRDRETELGRLFADILCDSLGLDVMLVGSGSIRVKEMGPIVEFGDLTQAFPYSDNVYRMMLTGAQLKKAISYYLRPENFGGQHTEFYQISHGIYAECAPDGGIVGEILFEGKPIDDEKIFRVGMQSFHFKGKAEFIGITDEEAEAVAPCKVVATSDFDVIDEWMSSQEIVKLPEDVRWVRQPGAWTDVPQP